MDICQPGFKHIKSSRLNIPEALISRCVDVGIYNTDHFIILVMLHVWLGTLVRWSGVEIQHFKPSCTLDISKTLSI